MDSFQHDCRHLPETSQVTGVFEIWSSFASYISYATEVSYSVFITEYEYEYYSAPQNNVILHF